MSDQLIVFCISRWFWVAHSLFYSFQFSYIPIVFCISHWFWVAHSLFYSFQFSYIPIVFCISRWFWVAHSLFYSFQFSYIPYISYTFWILVSPFYLLNYGSRLYQLNPFCYVHAQAFYPQCCRS